MGSLTRIAAVVGGWAALIVLPVSAQQEIRATTPAAVDTEAHLAGMPSVTAVRAARAITLDARLDEAAWIQAPVAPALTQTDPDEGAPGSERSEIRLLFDDDALYVGAFLHDRGAISTRLARRDADIRDSDWFAIYLDSHHDHLTAYRFAVNPSGVKRDEVMTGSSSMGGDTNWDPVWDVVTAVTDSGWVVEMEIPLSQLRFSRDVEQIWGVQLERRIGRKNEQSVLAFTSRRERGGIARYGHIQGISGLRAGQHNFELLPYMLGRADYRKASRSSLVSFDDPFHDGSLHDAGFGADIKFRPTSNITIDATVNPDFGQVEVDPAVINLTAFETRFDERRPFFVEGADLFRFGGSDRGSGGGMSRMFGGGGGGSDRASPSSLLYSRRIGRPPQGSVPSEAVYSDVADATTIIGASKVTARLGGGWSIALLDAVTAEEKADFVDVDDIRHAAPVEPLTNYFAGRVRRDMRNGQSILGAMVTGVNRSLSDDALAGRLRSSAYSGGIDFRHEWDDRNWSVLGYVAGSRIHGSEDVLISAQRSSARYYQRPDADYVEIDSAATSLSGYAARVDVGKRAGTWRGNVALSATSPGYEINDIGFNTRSDDVSLDTNLNYEQTIPGRIFRRWSLRTGPDISWNFGGERTRLSFGAGGSGQLRNFWFFGYNVSHQFESIDPRLTRGGVRALDPAETSGFFFLNTDSRKAYTGWLSLSGAENAAGGWRWSTSVRLGIKPAENWDIQVGPSISRSRSAAQYVTSVTDETALATLGRRYIFAPLRQTTVSMETRLNVTFSPDVSLELFAQPFISSGDYGDLAQLRQPGTFEFETFGRDIGTVTRDDGIYTLDADGGAGPSPSFYVSDRDFNFRSLRGNAVLRWEWRPGSTIFLVWQQNRSERRTWDDVGADYVGNFSFERDARRMFDLRPDNVFMIKATWWVNP